MEKIFDKTIKEIKESLDSMDLEQFRKLLDESEITIKKGNKIVVSGLGKNVPICEKFVGTMLSMGLDANFLHTNSAVHGDMGMVKKGDMAIILTKSGETRESIYLAELLKKREGIDLWLLTFKKESTLINIIGMDRTIALHLGHEGDPWNIVPNNSTTINLIILQTLAMQLAERMQLTLEKDFKPNHPGGAIGDALR